MKSLVYSIAKGIYMSRTAHLHTSLLFSLSSSRTTRRYRGSPATQVVVRRLEP